MSLTRIGSIGINTGIAFAGVTTIVTLNTANDALSIGATVNVGSGVTLGASGDIFATGVTTSSSFVGTLTGDVIGAASQITVADESSDTDAFVVFTNTATGNNAPKTGSNLTFNSSSGALTATSFVGSGANLTNLDASDLASGTVPTARLGSGTASSSTFLRGDSTFQTVNTDLVSDTTPQLGGNLDVNTKNIVFGDSSDGSSDDVLSFGASGDLKIFHQADQSRIVESGPSVLKIMGSDVRIANAGNTADYIQCNDGSDVKLYHNGNIKLETTSTGVTITDNLLLDGSANLGNYIRTNYDGGGHMYFRNNSGSSLNYSSHFQTYRDSDEGGTAQTHIHYYHGGYCELLHQGDSVIRTLADGVQFRDGGAVKGQFTDEGLCFGTDTASANALDDYEEGTWTPAFSAGETLTVYSARYVKIGRLVTANCYIYNFSDLSGNSNRFDIEGLPFPASGSNYHGGGFIGYAGVMNYGYPLLPLVVQGQAIGYFHRQDGTNNTWKYSDMHNVGNGSSGQLIVTFIYETGT